MDEITRVQAAPLANRLGNAVVVFVNGIQAAFLDARVECPAGYAQAVADMESLASQGVKIIAPPMFALLALDAENHIVPSDYAVAAKEPASGSSRRRWNAAGLAQCWCTPPSTISTFFTNGS